MTCLSLPELDDQTLLAYVDGEADPETRRHVAQCPHCQEKVRRLAALQDRLTTQLYRIACPTPHELGEHHLVVLSPSQAHAVAEHLALCPHCAREVAQLEEYLGELAPSLEPGLLQQARERARVWVARLVSGGVGSGALGQPAFAPLLAGVRGADTGPLVYQAEDVQVIIEVQGDVEQPDRAGILGLATGLGTIQGVEAELCQAGVPVASVPVDDLGNFSLSGVSPGCYVLILRGADFEIRVEDLEVGLG